MFNRLREKWQVNTWRFALIVITFALGGSLTGYAGRKIMVLMQIDNPLLWIIVYILLITILWPMAVLVTSIPFGQFIFFMRYLRRMSDRLRIAPHKKQNMIEHATLTDPVASMAIFASGAGSNAEKMIEYALGNQNCGYRVKLIVCNKPGAGVLNIAAQYGISTLLIEREKFFRGNAYVDELKGAGIDFIALAGFLWKIPQQLVAAFPQKITNIHPALLPKYGGKGMYGQFVYEAVIANKDTESGITIHWVDEQYDHGSVIFQATCPVFEEDTAETLASRIHQLEHLHYPEQLMKLLLKA